MPVSQPIIATLSFGGDAQLGSDYQITDSKPSIQGIQITIAAGELEGHASLNFIDDGVLESAEQILVSISDATGADFFLPSDPLAIIIKDDEFADYGDAPSPFPSGQVLFGAVHVPIGPVLGSGRDAEIDGNPSESADGDDLNGDDDEDGVVFGELRVGQLKASAVVTVQDGPARLDAWLDFDGDGNWSGDDERIAFGLEVQSGENILEFAIPPSAVIGGTIGRFRLSTIGELPVTGLASDGEIEDYRVEILGPKETPGVFLPVQTSGNSEDSFTTILVTTDIDRDGDIDIIRSKQYENISIELHEQTISTDTIEIEGSDTAYAVVVSDIDLDGDFDIIWADAPGFQNRIMLSVNEGDLSFSTPMELASVFGSQSLDAADFDGDGDIDIVIGSRGGSLSWLENINGTYEQRLIASNFATEFLVAKDFDRDGKIDVLTSIGWWKSIGNQRFQQRRFSDSDDFPNRATVSDIDGDGDLDFATGNEELGALSWYENDGSGNFSEHLISDDVGAFADLGSGDLDGDGDLDLIVAQDSAAGFRYYENLGDSSFVVRHESWYATPTTLLSLADFDGDGDLDLVTDHNGIDWYANNIPITITADKTQGSESEQTVVLLTLTSLVPSPSGSILTLEIDGARVYPEDYLISDSDLFEPGIQIELLPGESSVVVPLTVIDDGVYEGTELAKLRVSKATEGVSPIVQDDLIVEILDNDNGDWGDLPSPFRTLAAEDGAVHASLGPRLGLSRDTELNGNPSDLADGDDNLDSDDEDGVQFSASAVGMLDAQVSVFVTDGPARLDAWVDFNGDGGWNGAGEQIFISREVSTGENLLSFDVPGTAFQGAAFARFRLSTKGDLAPVGVAEDGEVEDYRVEISAPGIGGGFKGLQLVDSSLAGAIDSLAVDIDQDGDMDIVASAYSGAQVVWYENNGNLGFDKHVVANNVNGAAGIFAADIDGDGDVDIIAAASLNNQVVWFENDGDQNFEQLVIASNVSVAWDVSVADLDSDGHMDILATSIGQGSLYWLKNDGAGLFTTSVVSENLASPHSVEPIDFDRDGDLDLILSARDSDSVVWLENDGFQQFVQRNIATGADGVTSAVPADLDGDGDIDVIAASNFDNSLRWYENQGDQTFLTHLVTDAAHFASNTSIVDYDGDGDLDLILAALGADSISWFENDGNETFTQQILVTDHDNVRSAFPADIDQDGDIDIVAASFGAPGLSILLNAVPVSISVSANMLQEGQTEPIVLTTSVPAAVSETVRFTLSISGNGVDTQDFSVTDADETVPGIQVEIAAGSNSGSVEIIALDDVLFEGGELLYISLDEPSGIYGKSIRSDAQILIVDDELGDYGDAPASYSVSQSRLGAAHDAVGPVLGVSRDIERDVAPSGDASEDDLSGTTDDEDGVVFEVLHVGQAVASVEVVISDAAGKLDAWIDFDQDGIWGGPDEHVLQSIDVQIGANILTFQVPADAAVGTTFARFRLSTAGNLGPIGLAVDGEVEDHAVSILPAQGSGVFELGGEISNTAEGVSSIVTFDLDQDGDLDILSASFDNNTIEWFENDGNAQFIAHVITASADGASSVNVADIDGDGDFDVVSTSFLANTVAWHENDGNQQFTTRTVSTNSMGSWSSKLADMDADGDVDIVVVSLSDDKVVWYVNNGAAAFNEVVISQSQDNVRGIDVADIDGDGDMDIATAAAGDDKVVWHENLGQRKFQSHLVGSGIDGALSVVLDDIDADGDIDVLTSAYFSDRVFWFENNGQQRFERKTIPVAVNGAWGMSVADVDGDGDRDILAASVLDEKLLWAENDGAGNFVERQVASGLDGIRSFATADLDGDGDLDVVAGATFQDRITWYEAFPTVTVSLSTGEADEAEQTELTATVVLSRPVDVDTIIELTLSGDGISDSDFNIIDDDLSAPGIQFWFAAGTSIRTAQIEVVDDQEFEGLEHAVLQFSQFPDSLRVDSNGIRFSIRDNDLGDYGDAPYPFPTLQEVFGAAHAAVGPALGLSRDAEVDGLPTPDADGDDQTGNDEDGVSFGLLRIGDLNAEVVVVVSGGPAKLDAWIDFNGDGSWDGPGENVFHSLEVNEGDNLLTFAVPTDARLGSSYARFRLSTLGSLTRSGVAADGEVEDLLVMIAGPEGGNTFASSQPVSPGFDQTYDIQAADIDGDQDLDFVVSSSNLGTTWFENDGTNNFTARTDAFSGTEGLSFRTVDMDGDSDVDVVVSNLGSFAIRWYENDGNGFFTERFVTSFSGNNGSPIAVADLDGDGDMDVVNAPNLSNSGGMSWYENDGNQNFTKRTIGVIGTDTQSVEIADFDRDGDLDVLSIHSSGLISVFRNNGLLEFTPEVYSQGNGPTSDSQIVDLDRDGDLDVLLASSSTSRLTLMENDGSGAFTGTVLIDSFYAVSVATVDIDSDGDLDIFSSNDVEIWFFENDGQQQFVGRSLFPDESVFVEKTLLVDIDQDGDLDLAQTGFGNGSVFSWSENLGNQPPSNIELLNVTSQLNENSDTTSSIKIADIVVTDDGFGLNNLSIVGADAEAFEIVGTELFLKAGILLDFETKQAYTISVSVDDPEIGGSPDATTDYALAVLDLAEVAAIQVGDGSLQRSRVDQIEVKFDGEVEFTADAFSVVQRHVDGQEATAVDFNVTSQTVDGQTVVIFSFFGSQTRAGGALIDGNYMLTIDGAKVTRNRIALDGDMDGVAGGDSRFGDSESDEFFAFYADVDGNRVVDVEDFGVFRDAYGTLEGDENHRREFDVNADAVINLSDFAEFRRRFGSNLSFD